MKKSILLSAFLAAALGTSAQIPNAGFESWTTIGSYSNPDNWGTINAMTAPMSVYTAEKGTPGSVGASYLKLTSKTVTGMGVMTGIAATGNINTTTMAITGGFPYTVRALNLTGSWQYMAMSTSDAGYISVYLTKWNTGTMKRDTVASAVQSLSGMAMSWAPFSIPLAYSKSFTPDSALIIMSSSSGFTPANGSYLWVDNLAFSGTATTAVASIESNINNVALYPNPAKNKINLSFSSKVTTNYTAQIINILGKVVNTSTVNATQGSNQLSFDVSTLPSGTYSLSLNDGTQSSVQKFIVQ